MIRTLALVTISVLVAAASCPRTPPPAASAAAPDTLLVLERYHTLGMRAAYVVRIEPGGIVRYDGRAPIPGTRARLGPRQLRVDTLEAGATRRLVAAFERAGFEAFPDTLAGGAPPCGPTPTDGGLARVVLSIGERTKQVLHELACPAEQSAALAALEAAIDRAAGTNARTGLAR